MEQFMRVHRLKFDPTNNVATCTCGRWALSDRKKPLTEDSAQRNHILHLTHATGQGEEEVTRIVRHHFPMPLVA
ncbi:MAG: hypothetical protein ACRCZI_05390 [Cetobacterium sp.]